MDRKKKDFVMTIDDVDMGDMDDDPEDEELEINKVKSGSRSQLFILPLNKFAKIGIDIKSILTAKHVIITSRSNFLDRIQNLIS